MIQILLLLLVPMAWMGHADAQVWGTATSTNPNQHSSIVYRYLKDFAKGFDQTTRPDRFTLVWKYKSSNGMPARKDRERMDEMEALLGPVLETDGFATLVLVSTGQGQREWTYYAQAEKDVLPHLNKALSGKARYPIEIHTEADPQWRTYRKFRARVKE